MTAPLTNGGIDRRVRSEAERWLVRLLDVDTNDPRRVEFERWIAADPVHAKAYRQTEELWRLGVEAARHPDLRAAANRAVGRAHSGPGRQLRIWLAPAMAVAAAVFFLGGVVALWWPAHQVPPYGIRYATRTGQQQTIQLQDGSALLLDTDSAVIVRYGVKARGIVLLHGRAEFRVRHDDDWPFIVSAAGGTVTDVGTTFQVSIGSRHEVSVVLLEGKVSVATAHSNSTLTTGEALRFDHARVVRVPHPADLQEALGWTSGEVVASGWTLPRLLAEMNRYSGTTLEMGDASLRNIRVTGTFRAGDQATLLKVLESGWPIRAHRLSSTKIVLLRDQRAQD
ncbi:MAG TPA: FecR domain-containing protein [Rhodanobacteraceae bacterium]|nr:FecR domain-containing protein [Rhodanobacteraceae bacterium]